MMEHDVSTSRDDRDERAQRTAPATDRADGHERSATDDPGATRGTRRHRVWRQLSREARRPVVGAAIAGSVVLAAGALCGVTEAAIAGVAAWAVFRTLRARRSPASGRKDGVASAGTTRSDRPESADTDVGREPAPSWP